MNCSREIGIYRYLYIMHNFNEHLCLYHEEHYQKIYKLVNTHHVPVHIHRFSNFLSISASMHVVRNVSGNYSRAIIRVLNAPCINSLMIHISSRYFYTYFMQRQSVVWNIHGHKEMSGIIECSTQGDNVTVDFDRLSYWIFHYKLAVW